MSEITHATAAPFVGRILLATAEDDELAFFAAIAEAQAADVTPAALLVVVAQGLTLHMDAANPNWKSEVRRGLIEGQQ
jgi:hypothetical protein